MYLSARAPQGSILSTKKQGSILACGQNTAGFALCTPLLCNPNRGYTLLAGSQGAQRAACEYPSSPTWRRDPHFLLSQWEPSAQDTGIPLCLPWKRSIRAAWWDWAWSPTVLSFCRPHSPEEMARPLPAERTRQWSERLRESHHLRPRCRRPGPGEASPRP